MVRAALCVCVCVCRPHHGLVESWAVPTEASPKAPGSRGYMAAGLGPEPLKTQGRGIGIATLIAWKRGCRVATRQLEAWSKRGMGRKRQDGRQLSICKGQRMKPGVGCQMPWQGMGEVGGRGCASSILFLAGTLGGKSEGCMAVRPEPSFPFPSLMQMRGG